ncbi:Uncharacterised protein [Mycobacterium tuberculosis]|uniref:Uncharacterized protein n=1 Tax=Mycobacterium tuberculosis TaxID=1773 RepID=A0A916PDE4_MYCTX|nr:Uncharacterised protein [Mycobacterium tuberculosis]COW34906.1 Uncharacterised protein [Mycobacterium tuberculosis]COW73921.1 Uncharacterised protein [Mycobacterium tuberculosis]CPB79877.1 Uncharacterised protein [Mycobacterium tuberculosis]
MKRGVKACRQLDDGAGGVGPGGVVYRRTVQHMVDIA